MVQLKTVLDLFLQSCITLWIVISNSNGVNYFGGYLLKCIYLYDVSMFQEYEFQFWSNKMLVLT